MLRALNPSPTPNGHVNDVMILRYFIGTRLASDHLTRQISESIRQNFMSQIFRIEFRLRCYFTIMH